MQKTSCGSLWRQVKHETNSTVTRPTNDKRHQSNPVGRVFSPVHCLHTPGLINCFTAKLKEMLTLQEAERFAVEVLKVPYKAERVKNDPVSLLNEMTQAFHAAIPFHGISLLSVPAKERSLPSVEQIKEDVLAGRGGLCYTLNTFMKLFLEALGYTTSQYWSHIGATAITPNDHIMTPDTEMTQFTLFKTKA